jgi:hypothetical protein
MTRTHGPHPLLAQLEAVLDTYGARSGRWPEAVRAELLAFIAQDAQAARLLAEAQALDRMLDGAPPMPPHGLESRIMAAAASLPQEVGRGEAMPPRRATIRTGKALVVPSSAKRGFRRMWPELTLLAASLFLGLLIGLSGQALPALQRVALLTGDDDAWGITGLLFDGAPAEEAL